MQQTIYLYSQMLNIIRPDQNENKGWRVLYLLLPQREIANFQSIADRYGLIIVEITGMNWERDLTPWPAPAVFAGQNDFPGNAPEYLQKLLYELIPYAEKHMGIGSCERILGGVSLAGLFTVYALYHTDMFAGGISVSGSFWYDGFIDYMKEQALSETIRAIYLSVGIKEKNTKNKKLRTVEECTVQASEILRKKNIAVKMEQTSGNHFVDAQDRIEKAVAWIVQEREKNLCCQTK